MPTRSRSLNANNASCGARWLTVQTWRRSRAAGLFGLFIYLSVRLAVAQEENQPSIPSPPEAATVAPATPSPGESDGTNPAAKYSGGIKYVGPDTYILLDSEGHPQPVPGMTYEDFMAAWKQSQNVDAGIRQPRYAIESVEVNGQANEQTAKLKFDVTVRLLTDQPIEVPLGLVDAILQKQPEFSRAPDQSSPETNNKPAASPHTNYLEYRPERGGFVARLDGGVGERHTI